MQHSLIRPGRVPVLARAALGALAVFAAFTACSGDAPPPSPAAGSAASQAPDRAQAPAPQPPPPPAPAGPLVVFLGDSLTAGYGLPAAQAYPTLVEARLKEMGVAARVLNAGISGDTTAGGLGRLDWLLAQKPAVVVIALGGNDGLRGLPVEMSERNLREMIARCREAGARVLLAGMMMPPSYGPEYTEAFRAMYPELAKETGVTLMPFLLEGVAADPALNQADGIHPNARGQEIVAGNVAPYVAKILGDEGESARVSP